MHVVYLIPTIDRIGGAERQLILLATGMAQRGCQVTVIALSGNGGTSAGELSIQGVSFHSLEMRKGLLDPRGWLRLHRWLTLQKPDLVHAHLPHAALLTRWSRLAAPVRVLVETIHSPATGSLSRRLGFKISSRLPDVVTAVSRSAAKAWVKHRMVDQPRLVIIPNGIDLRYWKRNHEGRAETLSEPRGDSKFIWLAVGRLDPVKDHATLLRAFARLPVRAQLLVAGTGYLESTLRKLARELGVDQRVSFLGFQNDILGLMLKADAFVLNSCWEGLPVALIEACACELPAIVTNTPGAGEVLSKPLVDPVPTGDPDALASAMNTLMSLPESERRAHGTRERESITSMFSLDSVLDQYEALYRDALGVNLWPMRTQRCR